MKGFSLVIALLVLGFSTAVRGQESLPRIGVRSVDGQGEFYNTETGEPFIIRGPNYHHLERDREGYVVDTLFAPAHFDPARIARELQAMRDLGYNVVRTSLDICRRECLTVPGAGLSEPFLDNIATFLRLAHDAGLYVILTSNDFPIDSSFVALMEAQCCMPFDGYMNTHYLSPIGLETWKRYWQGVIQGLMDRAAPLETILGYSVRGEMWLFSDAPPLSLTSGQVRTANGETYDLSDPEQKQRMVEEGAIYWLDQMRAAIHALQPDVLVTVGMFTPNEPNEWRAGDTRYVLPLAVLARSTIDFFDLHPYPGYISLDALMENYHLGGLQGQPVILGEFGAFKFHYNTPEAGALGIRDWQIASCRYPFTGWMQWHWTGLNDHEVWTGTEGDSAINRILSPALRPDPCAEGEVGSFGGNLALGQTVHASQALPEEPPAQVVDGTAAQWGSGNDAPQWIEITLSQPATITSITLWIAQYPNGRTHHQVWVVLTEGRDVLLADLDGPTTDDQRLLVELPAPLADVRAVRVNTLSSPSWVAWKEIEVTRGEAATPACMVFAQGVNLRAEPSTAAAVIGSLVTGAVVTGSTTGGDDSTWYQLLAGGAWVREDVVTTMGNC